MTTADVRLYFRALVMQQHSTNNQQRQPNIQIKAVNRWESQGQTHVQTWLICLFLQRCQNYSGEKRQPLTNSL